MQKKKEHDVRREDKGKEQRYTRDRKINVQDQEDAF